MSTDERTLQRAYIEAAKRQLCGFLDYLTDAKRSGMRVSVPDYERACNAIREAIDEMFYGAGSGL